MRTKYTILFIVLIAVIGCKKNNDAFRSLLVQSDTYYNSTGSGTNNYSYNFSNYITSGYAIAYRYSGNLIIETTQTNNGPLIDTFFINSANLVDSLTNHDWGTRSEKFGYDSSGFLINEKIYTFGSFYGAQSYVINNGNIVTQTNTDTAGNILSYYNYEYYTTGMNTIGNKNYGQAFLGSNSTNLVKKAVFLEANGDTSEVFNYEYLFDSYGRVSTTVTLTTGYYQSFFSKDSTVHTYY